MSLPVSSPGAELPEEENAVEHNLLALTVQTSPTTVSRHATCELYLQKTNPPALYAMTAAHSLFNLESSKVALTLSTGDSGTLEVHSRHASAVSYRDAYDGEPESIHTLFTNDCALFKLSAQQIASLTPSPLQLGRLSERINNIADLIQAHEEEVPIMVRNFKGHLYRPAAREIMSRLSGKQCVHLTFVLDSPAELLVHGDSGSIVYEEENRPDGRVTHYALGLLIGRLSTSGYCLYEAILIHQALKDIEEDCSSLALGSQPETLVTQLEAENPGIAEQTQSTTIPTSLLDHREPEATLTARVEGLVKELKEQRTELQILRPQVENITKLKETQQKLEAAVETLKKEKLLVYAQLEDCEKKLQSLAAEFGERPNTQQKLDEQNREILHLKRQVKVFMYFSMYIIGKTSISIDDLQRLTNHHCPTSKASYGTITKTNSKDLMNQKETQQKRLIELEAAVETLKKEKPVVCAQLKALETQVMESQKEIDSLKKRVDYCKRHHIPIVGAAGSQPSDSCTEAIEATNVTTVAILETGMQY